MSRSKQGMFVLPDGKNVLFTFCLVSSLFLLWGFCNGMIDVMDKHFQEELHLSLSQSAWVQFAHWMGYFLMSLPAGWLATRLGYKGGIIAGLLMVAVGGFWFIPATQHRGLLGLSARRVRRGLRPDVPGNGGQSLHHGARAAALRRHAHQPGPVVQRRRLDLWPDCRQPVLLRQGHRGPQHGRPDALDSLRGRGGGGPHSGRHFLLRSGARHQGRGRLPHRRQATTMAGAAPPRPCGR